MQFYINNVMNDKLYIADGFEIPSLNTEMETRELSGRDGFILGEKRVKGYNFPIPFHYINHENKSYQDINNELVEFFNRNEEVRLRFEDEYWYWNVVFTGSIEFQQRTQGFVSFELNCIIADPFKYSNEIYNTVSEDDHMTLLNNGTAQTYPIFRARALQDATMFMLTKNDEEYIMMGKSESALQEVKDLSPIIYTTAHENTTGWTQRTTEVPDSLTGGAVGGTMTVSNQNSFTVLDYGDPVSGKWYGGALQRSLSSTIGDYEITTKMRMLPQDTTSGKGVVKGFIHLADESGNLVASLGMVDPSKYKKDTRVVIRIYDVNGNAKDIYHSAGIEGNAFHSGQVYIKLIKKGNVFSTRTWKYVERADGSKQITARSHREFVDIEGNYDRSIRQVIAYIAKHGTQPTEVPFRIYHTTIKRIMPDEADVTPLIIKQNDEIEIDTKQELMLLNGEPVIELKDFGATYFSIPQHLTEVFIEPENTFEVEAEWRDRYY